MGPVGSLNVFPWRESTYKPSDGAYLLRICSPSALLALVCLERGRPVLHSILFGRRFPWRLLAQLALSCIFGRYEEQLGNWRRPIVALGIYYAP